MYYFHNLFYENNGTRVVLMDSVIINDNYGYQNYDYLKKVVEKTLIHEKAQDAILSIVFVDEDEITGLNREYRGIDRVTDVISFAFEDNENHLPEEIRILGDIYICIPKMIVQAKEYGHSEKRELSFLVVHGLLHLLGYDHQSKEEEEVMFSLQDSILNSLDITR